MKTPTCAYIKRLAKKLKKERLITHAQALDLVAKEYGYTNWKHCSRMLSQQPVDDMQTAAVVSYVSFTEWLGKQKNRNSPLGDLASDMLCDSSWPLHDSLEEYRQHLSFKNASWEATETLGRAWKSYKAYLKRKESPVLKKDKTKKPFDSNQDMRKITYLGKVTPVQIQKRTSEKFGVGDKAWVSWDGRKAIPVTILEVHEHNYTFRIERPRQKAGNSYSLFSDEVRSTPELACRNRVTN